jgi:hypothetical protein
MRAPLASLTVPLMMARSDCANVSPAVNRNTTQTTIQNFI